MKYNIEWIHVMNHLMHLILVEPIRSSVTNKKLAILTFQCTFRETSRILLFYSELAIHQMKRLNVKNEIQTQQVYEI